MLCAKPPCEKSLLNDPQELQHLAASLPCGEASPSELPSCAWMTHLLPISGSRAHTRVRQPLCKLQCTVTLLE